MRVSKNAERYLTKRQTLITRKEECTNAIRDLGILPEEAYTNNVNTAIDKVCPFSHTFPQRRDRSLTCVAGKEITQDQ